MSKKEAKYPQSALDSVLSDSGTMPAARLWIRLQAFIFDFVFVNLLASLIIWAYIMPEGFTELNDWKNSVIQWLSESGPKSFDAMPKWDESLTEIMNYALFLMTLSFWVYFAVGELFFAGKSFGKAICRLRSISIVTMEKPSFYSAIFRSGLKAFCLLYSPLMVITLIVFGFSRRRQMGHDLLCHTAVVDERYIAAP